MANISGYGLTLSGASLGSFTGIESVTIGGLEVDFSEIRQVSDTNRIPENLPLTVREQPMEIVFTYNKTIYDTLRDAAKLCHPKKTSVSLRSEFAS